MCPNEEGRRENEQRVDAGAGDRKGKKEPAKHRAGKQPRYRTKKSGAIASGASRAGFGYEQQERDERDERQSAGRKERRPPADIVAARKREVKGQGVSVSVERGGRRNI